MKAVEQMYDWGCATVFQELEEEVNQLREERQQLSHRLQQQREEITHQLEKKEVSTGCLSLPSDLQSAYPPFHTPYTSFPPQNTCLSPSAAFSCQFECEDLLKKVVRVEEQLRKVTSQLDHSAPPPPSPTLGSSTPHTSTPVKGSLSKDRVSTNTYLATAYFFERNSE